MIPFCKQTDRNQAYKQEITLQGRNKENGFLHMNQVFSSNMIVRLFRQNFQIKEEISNLKRQLQRMAQIQTKTSIVDNFIVNVPKKIKRIYKKSEVAPEQKYPCAYKDCHKKYSSRIALNSHLRKKHRQISKCSVQDVLSASQQKV